MISFKLSSNPLNCLPVTVLTKSNTKSNFFHGVYILASSHAFHYKS